MDGGEVVLANSIYAMNGSERIHGLNIVHDPPIYILSSIQTTSIYLYYCQPPNVNQDTVRD